MLDTAIGTLSRDGREVALGGRALALLQALAQARGQVVEKSELMALGWPGLVVEESNLSVQVAALRKVLGRSPGGGDWIVTIPRRGYRLAGAVALESTGSTEPSRDSAPGTGLGQRPSIAVLPFKNLSGDPSQDYFVEAIAEDVIAALTRFRWFRVVGLGPSFASRHAQDEAKRAALDLGARYLVQGSVRRSAEKVRISAELVDAASGHCLWAEHYDFDAADVFAVQDRIARRVAGSIEPELLQRETDSIATAQRAGSLTGWDLVAKGCWNFHRITRPTHETARELFLQARQADPLLVEAAIWLARVDAGILAFGWCEDPASVRAEGIDAALQAIRMDEKNGYAHYALAIMSVFSDAFDAAIRAGQRAVELVPSFALGHLVLGMARLYSGDARGAVASLEEGLELNRHDPHNFIWYNALALAFLFAGEPGQAIEAAGKSLTVRPQWHAAMQTLAAACAASGRHDEARQWRERAARLERPAADTLQPLWQGNPRWEERMKAWLA